MRTKSEPVSHRSELGVMVAPWGRDPFLNHVCVSEEEEGVEVRSSAMGRRSAASVATAVEGSVWSCRGWRCYKVNPETTVILVFKLVQYWNVHFQ